MGFRIVAIQAAKCPLGHTEIAFQSIPITKQFFLGSLIPMLTNLLQFSLAITVRKSEMYWKLP